jgi:hypothetical protein
VLATDYGPGKGWEIFKKYEFDLCYYGDRVTIAIDGKPVFDVKGTFPAGRFGFYNYSQAAVRYEGFTRTGQPLGSLMVVATGERMSEVLAPSQVELILDASGSMREQKGTVGGRLKIDVAKDVMAQIIESLPAGVRVALRVYGHRIREGQKGACQDSELVFPLAAIDKARLLQRVRQVQALGTTPIAFSLQQVARDFGNVPGEKKVVLVTDGREECGGDPSAAVQALRAKGLNVRVDVVGLALADDAAKREMTRVAELTGGRFFDAKDAETLRRSMEQSLAVSYDVFDASGTKVGGGLTGQGTTSVPEGTYTVVVNAAGKAVTIQNVRITSSRSTTVELVREGQEIRARVVGGSAP